MKTGAWKNLPYGMKTRNKQQEEQEKTLCIPAVYFSLIKNQQLNN